MNFRPRYTIEKGRLVVGQTSSMEHQFKIPNKIFAYLKRAKLSNDDQNMPTPMLYRLTPAQCDRGDQCRLESIPQTVTVQGSVHELREVNPALLSYDRITGGYTVMHEEDREGFERLSQDFKDVIQNDNALLARTYPMKAITSRFPLYNLNPSYESRQRAYKPMLQPAFNQDILTSQGDKSTEASQKRGKDLMGEASAKNPDQEPKFPYKASKGRKGGRGNSKASSNSKSGVRNVDLLETDDDSSTARTASPDPMATGDDVSQPQQSQHPSKANVDAQSAGSPRVNKPSATIFAYFDTSRRPFYYDLTAKPPPLRCPFDGKFKIVDQTIYPEQKPIREIRQINNINHVVVEIDKSMPMYLAAVALAPWEDEEKEELENDQIQVFVVRETNVDIQTLAMGERRGGFRSG